MIPNRPVKATKLPQWKLGARGTGVNLIAGTFYNRRCTINAVLISSALDRSRLITKVSSP